LRIKEETYSSMECKKKVAFLPAHPAQVWILNSVAKEISSFAEPVWYLREKEISTELADYLGIEYRVISRAGENVLGNVGELLSNTFKTVKYTQKNDIAMWVTKYSAGIIASWFLRRKSITFIDDDIDLIPYLSGTNFPFADVIIAPCNTRMGRFEKKTERFPGNFELVYLHSSRFKPDPAIFNELGLHEGEKYAVIRLSALQAHHDKGIRGISEGLLKEVIRLTDNDIRIFITSEKPISSQFEQYRLKIGPGKIHHALHYAKFFLGDSQTMTSEAAVLGTPAYRINDFVGKISYLEKLQNYGLAFGYKPGEEDILIYDLKENLENASLAKEMDEKRKQYLKDCIDPLPFFVNVIRRTLFNTTPTDK